MRRFRIAAIALMGLALAGCATPFGTAILPAITSASAATVDPQYVIVAANVFDGLQVTATQYLRLPRCKPTTGPICRDPRATQPIINAVRAGRKARNAAMAFVKGHPGQLGPGGLYDAMQTSVATLQNIFLNYNVAAAVQR